MGDLRLEKVISKFEGIAEREARDAILIGHSVGGLIVQKLINNGLGSVGICISSVAPNRMLSFDWGFFKNSMSIANPFVGDEPFYMDADGFYASFANSMQRSASDEAFERTATHDSRNVLRDCMLGPGDLDLDQTDRSLLFIGADEDEIIPHSFARKMPMRIRKNWRILNRTHHAATLSADSRVGKKSRIRCRNGLVKKQMAEE